jgi:murein DD-endopeptidase MepM/ murein hydrolase activator NlpD
MCRAAIPLSKIASKVGVTAREIAELNGIKDPNKIKLGQKLVLPSYAQAVPASASKARRRARAGEEARREGRFRSRRRRDRCLHGAFR